MKPQIREEIRKLAKLRSDLMIMQFGIGKAVDACDREYALFYEQIGSLEQLVR
jgi:hypothetical protein